MENANMSTDAETGYALLPSETTNYLDNIVVDMTATFSSWSLPYSKGSWDYIITNMWTIPGSIKTNYWGKATCTCTLLNVAGDFSVTKWGITTTRSTNDVYH
jgi:hypothetical protein